jgi:PAS domain S-box-containing protein
MANVRDLASEMEWHEQQLLEQRNQADKRTYRVNVFTGIVIAVLGLIGICAFAWLLHIHLDAQEQSRALIQEHRELLQATLSSIGDAVIATDADGQITFLNGVAQSLTGWSHDDASKRPINDVFQIVNEETLKEVENPALKALQEGKTVGLANHTVLISKGGAEWPIDDSAAPIRTEVGKLRGAILGFR